MEKKGLVFAYFLAAKQEDPHIESKTLQACQEYGMDEAEIATFLLQIDAEESFQNINVQPATLRALSPLCHKIGIDINTLFRDEQ